MTGARGHLVDAYCHGVLQGDLGLGAFESWLPGAAAPRTTLFDSPAGFAVRRWCPPLLGLEPHCPPARYLARRRELGAYRATRLLLRGSGVTAYLADTGAPGDLTPPRELGAAAAAPAYEIVRLEPLARQVADTSGTVDGFLADLAAAVHGGARDAVALSCGDGSAGGGGGRHARPGGARLRARDPGRGPARHAGRGRAHDDRAGASDAGFGTVPPGPHEVRHAAARWLADRPVGGRLTSPVLRSHLVWHAVATGLPLVLRYGAAGPGPRGTQDFLRATAGLGTDLVLLPAGSAQQADAADLAGALPHVYVAVGGDPAAVLARTPFGKVLYASGAVGLPELYVTGARRFRAGLDRAVAERVSAGEWSAADGQRVAALVGEGNARRVHRLPDTAAGRIPHPRPPHADTPR
jgi:hypothetical protein